MNYIENIYVCLTLPLLLAIVCTDRRRRPSMLFLLGGMTVCLLSSYISSFLAGVHGLDARMAAIEISPAVEECMKLLPALFGLFVFELPGREANNGILMTSVGFATFENACFLSVNGAANLPRLLIRGAATGAMHIVCGMLLGLGLLALWNVAWLKTAGTVAMLCFVIIYHAIYNLLVSQRGPAAVVGYLLPLLTMIAVLTFGRALRRRFARE